MSRFQPLMISLSLCMLNLSCGSHSVSTQLVSRPSKCQIKKSHPDRDYLVEVAGGTSVAQARDRASAALTRRLSAELRSEVKVETVESDEGQLDQVQESVSVSSHFKHAELIRPIERCETCKGSNCLSAVYLQRDELATRLIREISPDLKRLKESLRDLNQNSPLLRFTQAWYNAKSAAKRIEPIRDQLRLIERTSPDLQTVERDLERARTERAKREERLWVSIDHPQIMSQEDLPKAMMEGINGRISKALETIGLKRYTDQTCPNPAKNDIDVLLLSPRGELKCTLGLIGPQCKLALGVELNLCGAGRLGEDSWTELNLVGVDTRNVNSAISVLIKQINSDDFSAVLSKSLSPFIVL